MLEGEREDPLLSFAGRVSGVISASLADRFCPIPGNGPSGLGKIGTGCFRAAKSPCLCLGIELMDSFPRCVGVGAGVDGMIVCRWCIRLCSKHGSGLEDKGPA